MRKLIATLASIGLILGAFPTLAAAAGPAAKIRQEINITDAYFVAASNTTATSSAIIQLDTTKYSGTVQYYFEVEASTTAASDSVFLARNSGSGTQDASVSVNSATYGLFRSTAFTPPAQTQTEYVVQIGSASGVTGVKAARIVVIQVFDGTSNNDATSTETQIEIGNQETYSSHATSTLASPKYWYYNSSAWDGTKTAYGEVTYMVTNGVASSTTYAANANNQGGGGTGNFGLLPNSASTTLEAWGGGGAGGGSTVATDGGGGGAGGQYAITRKTFQYGYSNTQGGFGTLITSGSTKAGTTGNGTQGNASAFSTSTVATNITIASAQGGNGGTANNGAGGTGNTTSCIGDTCFRGGNGATGSASQGGGGGGGAGSGGAGGDTTTQTAGTGTATGGGNGGTGNPSGANAAGQAGSTAGGGGSGAFDLNASQTGGTGAAGQLKITQYVATSTISIQQDNGAFASWTDVAYMVTTGSIEPGVPLRFRSTSFTPVNGDHYRIAMSNGDSRTTIQIYSAKIIVDTDGRADTLNLLVVGGGGGGGGGQNSSARGGGGGAGGYKTNSNFPVFKTETITITVGGGGTAGATTPTDGGSGTASSFGSYITADGGGGGGKAQSGVVSDPGVAGASGGGGGGGSCHSAHQGGFGTFPEGFNGGAGGKTIGATCVQDAGGGGGGSSSAGIDDAGGTAGGNGTSNSITGAAVTYAVGGNAGGGTSPGTAGGANTGTGGNGGLNAQAGGAGGTGIVIVSYLTANAANYTCNGSSSTSGSNTICKYTASSTFVIGTGTYTPFTKIEGQYVLANTPLASGTALQLTLNSWGVSEYSGVANTVYEDVDSANGSASVVKIQDSTGATTYGTLSSPSNESTSTMTCIPSATTTLDSIASTNNSDVYGVRLLVDLVIGGAGGTGTSCTVAVGPATLLLKGGGQLQLKGGGQTVVK
jgi:hypothetical protein